MLHNSLQMVARPSAHHRVHTVAPVHAVAPTSQKFFVGSSNKKAKLIVLQVTGLQEDTKSTLRTTSS